MIDDTLLSILACPICKDSLLSITETEHHALYCSTCALYYPVYRGIPLLLKKEAKTEEEWKEYQNNTSLHTL